MTAIVDSKLLAYNERQTKRPVLNMFNTLERYLKQIEKTTKTKVTEVIFVYDFGKSKYRLGLWPEYKGTRTYSEGHEEFTHTYKNDLVNIAKSLGIRNFIVNDLEADDIAGILCNKLKGPVVLVTADQDWWGLLLRHGHVNYFNVRKFEYLTAQDIIEKTGCTNEQLFWIKKAASDDIGDNIRGIPNVGPVKSRAFVERLKGMPEDEWKTEFMRLCKEKTKGKLETHGDYHRNGITTCEEMYELNMALSRIMTGVKHLSYDQVLQLTDAWGTAGEQDLGLAKGLLPNTENAFGDSIPADLSYWRRLYETKTV